MGWVEPVSTIVTATSLANQLVQSSSTIRKHAMRLHYWFKNGKAVIPIFGAGGTGKTTAGKILTGADPLDFTTPYDESWLIEPVNLTGEVPGQLLISPGQLERTDRHWPQLLAKVVSGESFGIINVVAFGYHSLAIESFKEHDLFKPNMRKIKFMNQYTEHRRDIENQMLQKLMNGMTATTKPLWMVTLVNKQDLWWSKRTEVREHYENGKYADILNNFKSSHGTKHFQHEFIPLSLTIGNLITPQDEVLAETTAGYDLTIHVQHLRSMFTKLHDLVAQGVPE